MVVEVTEEAGIALKNRAATFTRILPFANNSEPIRPYHDSGGGNFRCQKGRDRYK
jgi:hypothetical protein